MERERRVVCVGVKLGCIKLSSVMGEGCSQGCGESTGLGAPGGQESDPCGLHPEPLYV